MTTTCPRCKSTGYLFRRFYVPARECSCPLGRKIAAFNALSLEDRAAVLEWLRLIDAAERKAARHARRDARRAAQSD
jgi:hypothetical protein